MIKSLFGVNLYLYHSCYTKNKFTKILSFLIAPQPLLSYFFDRPNAFTSTWLQQPSNWVHYPRYRRQRPLVWISTPM
mgnify:CR=1 FL=1